MNNSNGYNAKGSIIIMVLFIMMVMVSVTVTASSVVFNNYLIFKNDIAYQQAYYLAETGLNCAYNDLINTAYEVHEEITREYKWDPLIAPSKSIREGIYEYVFNHMGTRLRSRLIDKGILSSRYRNESVFSELSDVGTIDVSVALESRYNNPLKFTISSVGSSGSIKRRIDAVINIYKVSLYYDSILFDYAVVSGSPIIIDDGGRLKVNGDIYAQQTQVSHSSFLEANGDFHSPGSLFIWDGGIANIKGNIILDSLVVNGSAAEGGGVVCEGDLCLYNLIKAEGSNNFARIKGNLYNIGKQEGGSLTGGVLCENGADVVLEKAFYINACIKYESDGNPLFGIQGLIGPSEPFLSGESIGGGNKEFYFLERQSSYINKTFNNGYLNKSADKKADILADYIKTVPKKDDEKQEHQEHLQKLNFDGITIADKEGSYAKGAIFTDDAEGVPHIMRDDNVLKGKTPAGTVTAFFESVEKDMRRKTDWILASQYDMGFYVPYINAVIAEGMLFQLDNDKPIAVIEPDDVDIALPSGSYSGIIFTGGSVTVNKSDYVSFEGLIVAGEGLKVSGELALSENKDLILSLIKNEDEALSYFFKIGREPEFINVVSWQEKKLR